MRKTFIGYDPPTTEELELLWGTGIIVLDANVLLNLYRYSKEARNALLDLVATLKERLWLPHQVGLEYHRNRLGQIYGERKNCEEFVAGFRKHLASLDESRRHPFVTPEFRKKLDEIVESLSAEVKATLDELDAFKQKDPILEQISELYNGRVGAEPDAATRDAWLAEGEERYRRGIPPGFEDRKKPDERKFGDLFLWKQMLDYAGQKNHPVILVTDDAKKDWWREHNGETIGPNPALIAEMVAATGKPFHMYRPDRFVKLAGERNAKPIPDKIVEEVKKARVADGALDRIARDYANLRDALDLRELAEAASANSPMAKYKQAMDAATMDLAQYKALIEAARINNPLAQYKEAIDAAKLNSGMFAQYKAAMEAFKIRGELNAYKDALDAMKLTSWTAQLAAKTKVSREPERAISKSESESSSAELDQTEPPPAGPTE